MRLDVTGCFLTIVATLAFLAPAMGGPPSVDAAAVALHAGNASNAVALATQALDDTSLTPRDHARVLVDRGLAHEMLGERDGALVDLTEAIDARALPAPEQARAFYDRGVTLDELSRTEDAAGDYSAAIRLEPKFAAAFNNRGNAYRRLNRLAEARADYQASIAAGNPHAEYPDFGLGQVAEAAGQTDEARAYYRAALAANPQFALAAERLKAIGDAPTAAGPGLSRSAGDAGAHPRLQTVADADAPDDGVVHLRPPHQAGAARPDDGAIHLRPPSTAPLHLHPPAARRAVAPAARAPQPGLKPAFSEGIAAAGQLIQLGAWRSQGDAANAWSRIAAASGSLLVGLSPQVLSVDLPGKGRFYRLRAGPIHPGDAPRLCTALRAKGYACLAVHDQPRPSQP
jgi:tetratricopeptide (TPR) repeat protein